MLGDYARDNRQAQAGPSTTRRKVWLKKALEIGRGNSFTRIFHGRQKQFAVNIMSRRDHDATTIARVSQRFQCVLDQVHKDPFHLLDVQHPVLVDPLENLLCAKGRLPPLGHALAPLFRQPRHRVPLSTGTPGYPFAHGELDSLEALASFQ